MSQRCPENNTPFATEGSRVQNICSDELNNFTRAQLDERRKVEILKYKKNANNITRTQEISRILRGASRFRKKAYGFQNQETTNPNTSNLQLSGNTLICPSTPEKCGMTSGANVPGKIMKLCFNNNVPLTRLQVRRTYD
jgi:hypothetical protein|tara:strand:+ start:62 stop:478 length:417 start_codon:yes stop_codon:yes gene_type:complete